jgi:ABC-2 type transport system permease protein
MYAATFLIGCVNLVPFYKFSAEEPNGAIILGNIIAVLIVGLAFVAIGIFVSALTENQLIAAILGIASSLGLYLLGSLVGMIPVSAIASLIGFIALAVILTAIVYLLTRNYVITSIVGCVTVIPLAVAYVINSEAFASLFPKTLEYLALFDRFYTFLGGIFDVGAIVYYISFAIFFIFLTVQSFDKRRWS